MEDLKAYRAQFDAIISDGEKLLKGAAAEGFNVQGMDPLLLVEELERQWMLLQIGPKTLRRALALVVMAKHLLSESIQTSTSGEEKADDEKIAKGEVAHG